MIRAKYIVNAKEEVHGGAGSTEPMITIKMNPVINGSEENKQFFKYTPGGEVRLQTVNVKAAEYFELGKEYYLDFTKAE